MHILLVAATKFEIQPTLELLEKKNYGLNNHTIELLVTGVGQVNATYLLALNLINKKTDLAIQAGIAGTFTDRIQLGQTILIKQDSFGDIGIEEKQHFSTLFDAGFAGKDDFPFTNGWLLNDSFDFLKASSLETVKAITVNKISDSLFQKKQLQQYFSPDIESMEGAAFHFVCLQRKIPFIQIRSISNSVGERDKTKWVIKDAVSNLNSELVKLINDL
jgi:futalosine hydrolase